MIKPEDLPHRWGLLYCHPQRVDIIAGHRPRQYDSDLQRAFVNEVNHRGEIRMLWSALNRLRINIEGEQFSKRVHLPYSEPERQQADTQRPPGSVPVTQRRVLDPKRGDWPDELWPRYRWALRRVRDGAARTNPWRCCNMTPFEAARTMSDDPAADAAFLRWAAHAEAMFRQQPPKDDVGRRPVELPRQPSLFPGASSTKLLMIILSLAACVRIDEKTSLAMAAALSEIRSRG